VVQLALEEQGLKLIAASTCRLAILVVVSVGPSNNNRPVVKVEPVEEVAQEPVVVKSIVIERKASCLQRLLCAY
jgi:hypothetical protein